MSKDSKARRLEAYIYLDREGIESLFAQTVERVETEYRESAEKSNQQRAGAKIGLGKAFSILLGLDVGASFDAAKGSKRLEEVKSGLTSEHKLERLREYLSEREELFDSLDTALKKSLKSNSRAFINIHQVFDVPQFSRGRGGAEQVNRDGAVLFQIDGPPKVVMSASLSKFPKLGLGGRLSPVSHDAITLSQARHVPINVFGYVISLKETSFQIKPYAIWI